MPPHDCIISYFKEWRVLEFGDNSRVNELMRKKRLEGFMKKRVNLVVLSYIMN